MKLKSISQRVKDLFDGGDILWREGDRKRVEKIVVEMLLDQIGDCSEVARRRFAEAQANQFEFEGCGRTVASHYIAKKDTAALIVKDIDALAAPYEPKKNPDIG